MFPQNSRFFNLFRLKNDTEFSLKMLQNCYGNATISLLLLQKWRVRLIKYQQNWNEGVQSAFFSGRRLLFLCDSFAFFSLCLVF